MPSALKMYIAQPILFENNVHAFAMHGWPSNLSFSYHFLFQDWTKNLSIKLSLNSKSPCSHDSILQLALLFATLVGKSGVKLTVRSTEAALLLRRPCAASGGCNVEAWCSTAVTTPSLKGASRMEKGAPGVRRGLDSLLVVKLLATLTLSTSSSAAASGTNMSTLVLDLVLRIWYYFRNINIWVG